MAAIDNLSRDRAEVSVWIRFLRSPWTRLALFTALLSALSWFAITHGHTALDVAREWTTRMGTVGAVLFTLIFALATLALFPATPLMAAAGLLYGPLMGVLLVWLGTMLGAIGSFLVGRMLSHQALEQLAGRRIKRLNALFTTHGTATVLLLRLIPVFPFALVNYGCAITTITFRQYLIGTAVGAVPATVAYVWLGDNVEDPTSPAFITALVVLTALSVIGALVARYSARRG